MGITNRLLARRQFVVDVLHPGRTWVSKEELTEKVAKMYSVKDKRTIILFGFRTQFGGGKSSGFCKIYDNVEAVKKFEHRYVLARFGLQEHKRSSRKSMKERKTAPRRFAGRRRRSPAKLHPSRTPGPRASPGARIRAWLPSRALNSSTSAGVTYIPTNNLVAAGGNARVNRITITPSQRA